MVYMLYVTFLGGDAMGYWGMGLQQVVFYGQPWHELYGLSTTFIVFLVYPFSYLLDLSFFTGSLLFSFVGFLGFTYVFVMMAGYADYIIVKGYKLFPAILFLPNLHFWSSGVGKDSLIFFSIALFVFCTRNLTKNFFLLILSFILIYHIRPHMGILFGVSLLMAFLVGSNLKVTQKMIGIAVGIIGLILIWPKVAVFLLVEDLSLDSLQHIASSQMAYLNRSHIGSRVDLANYPIPIRVFTYLFQPLFFDAHNLFALLVSFENLIYLLLTFLIIRWDIFKLFKLAPIYLKTGIIAFAGATIAFANSLSNLGIALRMKNMTMIYLLMFICFAIAYNQYFKAKSSIQKSR